MIYTSEQILTKLSQMGYVPPKDRLLIVGIQSVADNFNKFDDTFDVFYEGEPILSTTGTTNAGKNALLTFDKEGLSGAAVWKTNEIYPELYSYGLHKGKMPALRQVKAIKYYRDTDKDSKSEEIGVLHTGLIGANFHGVDYDLNSNKVSTEINGWSYACQVCNNMKDYREIITLAKSVNKPVDYALLKEFSI